MQIPDLPSGMEQLPDAEILACTLARMLDEGIDTCSVGGMDDKVLSIQDTSLMLCDVLRASRLGVPVTPATRSVMNCISGDLALFRAMNRSTTVVSGGLHG